MSAHTSRHSSPGRDNVEASAKRNTSCTVVRSKGQPEKYSVILTLSTRSVNIFMTSTACCMQMGNCAFNTEDMQVPSHTCYCSWRQTDQCLLQCRWDTQLLHINSQTGCLLFRNRKGADVFDTEVGSCCIKDAIAGGAWNGCKTDADHAG